MELDQISGMQGILKTQTGRAGGNQDGPYLSWFLGGKRHFGFDEG